MLLLLWRLLLFIIGSAYCAIDLFKYIYLYILHVYRLYYLCLYSILNTVLNVSQLIEIEITTKQNCFYRSIGLILRLSSFFLFLKTHPCRVNGVLAISRAFGDVSFKGENASFSDGPVIALPELQSISISSITEFAILASDGLWDVMSPQGAINFVRRRLAKRMLLKEISYEIVREAIHKGSVDNVTAVILSFHHIEAEMK